MSESNRETTTAGRPSPTVDGGAPDRSSSAADASVQRQAPSTTGRTAPRRRRFGGTEAQIRSALAFYKVMAYVTGTFLILLCIEMIVRYGAGYDLVAGGTDAATNSTVLLGLNHRDAGNLTGGLNLSTGVLIVHGWLYVIYLVSDFRLWSLMRWPFSRFILIALGGVIPGLSFVMERKIHREAAQEIVANPKAARRY